jgi:hypothetical protein
VDNVENVSELIATYIFWVGVSKEVGRRGVEGWYHVGATRETGKGAQKPL